MASPKVNGERLYAAVNLAGRGTRTLVTVAVVGLLAGAAISVFAFLVARYGPAGDGWSFKGNGALAVYTLVPVVLGAGWTALVLHARSIPSWLALGAGAGLVGLVIALADALLIPVLGTGADQALGAILLIALVAWMAIAPAMATRVPAGAARVTGVWWQLAADRVWLIAGIAGLGVVGFLIPAGS